MAGVVSDDRQIQLWQPILRSINGLSYTRQPSCIGRARKMKDLPYWVFLEGKQIAAFADISEALTYARVRSRDGGLVEVRETGGIFTQYRHGTPLTKEGEPNYASAEASST